MEKKGDEYIGNELRRGNISLVLESYNDIFSDFDPRSYSERALSDDFLGECRKAARDKDEVGLELILSIPSKLRDLSNESKIKKRLKNHFHKHFIEKENEIKKLKKEGIHWMIIGSILLFFATILRTYIVTFLTNFILVVFEPSGWFSFWEGLGKIFITSKEKEPETIFYKKMSNACIIFRSY